MPEPLMAVGAVGAGALCGGAVLVIGSEHLRLDFNHRLEQRLLHVSALPHVAAVRGRLTRSIERAGWNESPERVVVLAIVIASCFGLVGATVSFALAVLGFVGGCSAFVVTLNAAI